MAALIDSSGPYARWDRPPAFPSADLINGVNDKPVFDLGVDLDGKEGGAYIQVDHVIAMARSLGMVTAAEHDASAEEIGRLLEIIQNPDSELGRLTNVVTDLDRFVRDRFGDDDSDSDVPVEDSAKAAPAESGNTKASGNSGKPTLVKRSDELSSPPANDAFGFASLNSTS